MRRCDKILIAGLLYGPYTDLALRLTDTLLRIADPDSVGEIRLGANNVSTTTREVLHRFQQTALLPTVLCRSEVNVGKYPMMWRLLNDFDTPYSHVMWFDDDTHFIDPQLDGKAWIKQVLKLHCRSSNALVGHIHRIVLKSQQLAAIKEQAWWADNPFATPVHRVHFATGGWWIAPLDLFRRWGWPPAAAWHRGGDSMLGELCRQQGVALVNWYEGLKVNDAARRGFDPPWLWEGGQGLGCLRRPQFDLEVVYADAIRAPGPHP